MLSGPDGWAVLRGCLILVGGTVLRCCLVPVGSDSLKMLSGPGGWDSLKVLSGPGGWDSPKMFLVLVGGTVLYKMSRHDGQGFCEWVMLLSWWVAGTVL